MLGFANVARDRLLDEICRQDRVREQIVFLAPAADDMPGAAGVRIVFRLAAGVEAGNEPSVFVLELLDVRLLHPVSERAGERRTKGGGRVASAVSRPPAQRSTKK